MSKKKSSAKTTPVAPVNTKLEENSKSILSHIRLVEVLLFVSVILIGVVVFKTYKTNTISSKNKDESSETTTQSEIPTIKISLKDITLEEYQKGDKKTKYPDNTLDFTVGKDTTTYTGVEVRGRGNSTWTMPKPPFQLKFEKNLDLLGLGEAKKWVLLANCIDHSNLRNDIAFKMADLLDEKYAFKGDFVKVYVDDNYLGLYYLTHKMETKKGAVNLKDKYGILMEIDNLHRATEDCNLTKNNTCMTIKDTVADEDEEKEIMNEAVASFMDIYNRFEDAVRSGDYKRVQEVADTRSLAEYYIISEFSVNPDAYDSSVYFYKDGLKDILHAGPIWDYDYAFGNIWDDQADPYIFSPYSKNLQKEVTKNPENINEYFLLTEMPEFIEEVKAVYQEKLLGKKEEVMNWLKNRAAYIKEESKTDAERWGIEDAEKETEYFIEWVSRRFDYFEWTFGK